MLENLMDEIEIHNKYLYNMFNTITCFHFVVNDKETSIANCLHLINKDSCVTIRVNIEEIGKFEF